ncbi:MAG: hypothetical protein ACYSSI_02710, partial [Planctomycetota bacterium]
PINPLHNSYGIDIGNFSQTPTHYSEITNCTIYGHTTWGIRCVNPNYDPTIKSCILWNNEDELYNCSADYSCIQDWDNNPNNIHKDPAFIGADSNDYHLRYTSGCIDTGDPCSAFTNEPDHPDGYINIGAYGNTTEARATATDADGDGLADEWELLYWSPIDVNDANDDYDKDGFSNRTEYKFNYDPNSITDANIDIMVWGSISQIDPTASETVTVSYILNMTADVNVSFSNTDTSEIVRTINQSNVEAGYDNNAVWDGFDNNSVIVERYFYDTKIDANDGEGNSLNWTYPDGGDTSGSDVDTSIDFSDYNPYQNIPVEIVTDQDDWSTRQIDIVKGCVDGNCPGGMTETQYKEHLHANPNDYRICHISTSENVLEPGDNTFYWYGRWGQDIDDPNAGKLCEEPFDVYFDIPAGVNRGAILVYYTDALSNLSCNPYRVIPTNDEVATISYYLACDANVTIKITDPDGNYFNLRDSEPQDPNYYEIVWYGESGDPNSSSTTYFSTEGVYRIEVQIDGTNKKLEGSVTVYR